MTLVTYNRTGSIGHLTLERAQAMNTMTTEFLEDALSAFTQAAEDEEARVVILSGDGRAFCAGGDLSQGPGGAVSGEGTLEQQTDRLRRFMQTSELLHTMPKVVIAAVNGACAGAGLSWACAADLRFASSKARFNTAFLNAGLSGDFGGTWLLPRLIGASRAAEKYLLSEPFDAAEALDIGLVNRVFEPEQLMDEVEEIASRLIAAPALALRLIKENLRDNHGSGFSQALDLEASRHSYCARTEDAAEAAEAFTAKRAPRFGAQ